MKKFTRIICLLAAAVMAMTLCACQGEVKKGVFTSEYVRSLSEGFDTLILDYCYENAVSMAQFSEMSSKTFSELDEVQKILIADIRAVVRRPTNGTMLTKVISTFDLYNSYLGGSRASFDGFVFAAADIKHLKTVRDYYLGLSLDGRGGSFSESDQSIGVLRFYAENTDELIVPTVSDNGGDGSFDSFGSPFTGYGFTMGSGRLCAPEWYLEHPTIIRGELWEVFADGSERLCGIYSEETGTFVPVE